MSGQTQLAIQFEDGLLDRFRNLRDAVAAGVYQRGLKRVAMDLDVAPGNLSVQLADEGQRKFDLDDLERYIEVTHDKTPIYYLIAKFIGDQGAAQSEAQQQLARVLKDLPGLLAAAGANVKVRK